MKTVEGEKRENMERMEREERRERGGRHYNNQGDRERERERTREDKREEERERKIDDFHGQDKNRCISMVKIKIDVRS